MKFHILTIFPNILDSYLQESIIKRAITKKIISVKTYNLRDFSLDKHQTVDDTPYGGGAGMLMKIEPIYKAIKHLKKVTKKTPNKNKKIILLSASGKKWTQNMAEKYKKYDDLIFICGRYEGVDARIKNFIDEEISVGDYILTGGELPAMTIIDSIARLLPNVLGNKISLNEESHLHKNLGEYPQYTRPEVFKVAQKKYEVPSILLSGNHEKIKDWQQKNQKKLSS